MKEFVYPLQGKEEKRIEVEFDTETAEDRKRMTASGHKCTKKDCNEGFHGQWELIADTPFALVEQCTVCGKKTHYMKGSDKTTIDMALYLENHKIDTLQPYLPGGEVNPLFVRYYGDPSTYLQKIRESGVA